MFCVSRPCWSPSRSVPRFALSNTASSPCLSANGASNTRGLITDTVFTAGHEFVAETVQPGSAYRVYISGTWEIRNSNQLWQHNLRVSPSNLQVQEWEGTEIAVIDANHLRTGSGGDLFRVP